jgi:molybdopterin molybdotransferase
VVSTLHVPPHDNSYMDGYAVRCADIAGSGVQLCVSQRIPAGSVGAPLQAGTVARIFTGAPVPEGADAVVMQEDCQAVSTGEGAEQLPQVQINTRPAPGRTFAAPVKMWPVVTWFCRAANAWAQRSWVWLPA